MAAAPAARRAARPRRIRTLDFRRVSQFTRHQIRRIEHAHEQFCRSASMRLTSELGTEVVLNVMSTDQLPYSVVMDEEVPQNAIAAVITIEPHNTEIAMIVEQRLALSLVTNLLGGEVENTGEEVELTQIELAIARLMVDKLTETLAGAWSELGDINLHLSRIESSPSDVNAAPPSEPTLIVNMSAQVGNLVSIMTVCLPNTAVKHVAQRTAEEGYLETDYEALHRVRNHLCRTPVQMRAEIGSLDLELEDVLKLNAGMVLPLKAPVQDGVSMVLDGGPAFAAQPAFRGSTRVVRIVEKEAARRPASRAAAHLVHEQLQDQKVQLRPRVLGRLPVRVTAELGCAQLQLRQVTGLAGGELLLLDRSPNDPVEVFVDGLLYARGTLVEIDGEWAVQLSDVALQRTLLAAKGLSDALIMPARVEKQQAEASENDENLTPEQRARKRAAARKAKKDAAAQGDEPAVAQGTSGAGQAAPGADDENLTPKEKALRRKAEREARKAAEAQQAAAEPTEPQAAAEPTEPVEPGAEGSSVDEGTAPAEREDGNEGESA